MAGSLNRATLIGNLGKDPETKILQDGRTMANLTLATSMTWKDKNSGERREKVDWHRIVIWNEGLAKIAEQYLKKGSRVLIEGAIQTRKYTDQSGVEKYTTEIVLQGFDSKLIMLDRAGGESGGGGERQASAATNQSYGASRSMDDDIPFIMEWR